MAWSLRPARTYRTPSTLAVFQSLGLSSTTRTYSAIAASTFPCRNSFSAFRSVAARSMATGYELINGIKQSRRAERSPVRVGVAEASDRGQMVGGRVAFVAIEPIPWIAAVQLQHLAIARDLRHDRRRRNSGTAAIAVGNPALSHRQIRDSKSIDE